MIKIKDGEAVKGPGQYDMSMDHYHSQACCPGVSVSSSGLRKILLESPADFWAFSDLNENRWEAPSTEPFIFGRAAHALLLGEEDFDEKFAVIPESAPPKPLPSQINARAQGRVSADAEIRFTFWDAFNESHAGKDLLTEDDLRHIIAIGDNLKANPVMSNLLTGQAEQSLIWQDHKTGIWLKSRIDILSKNGDLADLKTTASKDPRKVERSIRDFGYDMQLGLATIALEEVLGIPFTSEAYEGRQAILMFVYKKPPYHIFPIELSFDALHWARLKCRKAIDTMAECIRSDSWPGPVEGILTWETPDWEVERIGDDQAAGLFPTTVQ